MLCTRCHDNQARERFSLAYIPANERPLKSTPRGVSSLIASKFTLTTFDSSIFFFKCILNYLQAFSLGVQPKSLAWLGKVVKGSDDVLIAN